MGTVATATSAMVPGCSSACVTGVVRVGLGPRANAGVLGRARATSVSERFRSTLGSRAYSENAAARDPLEVPIPP